MKKSLMVLVALFTMILIPWNVEALGLVYNEVDGEKLFDCKTKTLADQKITTCDIKFENDKSQEWPGGVLTLTLKPDVKETTYKFEIENSKVARLETSKSKDNVYVIDIEPVAAGKTVTLGTVTWYADASLTEENCAGDIITDVQGSDSGNIDTEDEEIVESGYAIPYIALAIGAVGVVTVLATSKKKTKMYKI